MTAAHQYYRDSVAVVTGAASGVGLALADGLLASGAKRVALIDVNDADLERETARLNGTYPDAALGIHCDVTDEREVREAIQQAAAFGDGRIDLLFNNAGAGFSGSFDDQDDEDWQRAFALNFYAAVYGIRAVLPIMQAHQGGHVVNTISGIALTPMAYQTRYAATKAALNGLSLALRYELWDQNIRVTSVTPGTTATAIWATDGGQPPADAQTPGQSARTILAGVAENQRLVLGDDGDTEGARTCFAPEAARAVDAYLLDVARRRRRGQQAV